MCDIDAPCSKASTEIINRARATAKTWLPKAQAAVEKYIPTPNAADAKRVAKILQANFGWRGTEYKTLQSFPETPKNLINTIKILRMKIDQPFQVGCGGSVKHPAINPRVAGELATSQAASLQDGENCFMFLMGFFKSSNSSQAKIIIHEMCHAWCAMSDFSYENDANWATKTIRQTESNPDSYACAIRDLGR